MPHSSPHIAVVFATRNRPAVALACLSALGAQSRLPDAVVVADNYSSATEVTALRDAANPLHAAFSLTILELQENLGNAGGVAAAMDHAFAQGADAVWILDDDSIPTSTALESLLAPGLNPNCVRHSMQIDPATGKFTWPLQVQHPNGTWSLANDFDELPPGDLVRSRIIWTGALLPRNVYDVVGPVMSELFIRGEDEEYPLRFEQAGFSQQAVIHSLLSHPGPADLRQIRFLGKSFFFEPNLADWKLYYKIRNMVWLKKHQQSPLHAALIALCYAYASATIDGSERLPLVWQAARDGWQGRLGRWNHHPA